MIVARLLLAESEVADELEGQHRCAQGARMDRPTMAADYLPEVTRAVNIYWCQSWRRLSCKRF